MVSLQGRTSAETIQAVGKEAGKVIYYRFVGGKVEGKNPVVIASADGKKVLDE